MRPRLKSLLIAANCIFLAVMIALLAQTLFHFWDNVRFKPEARVEMRDLWSRVRLGDSQRQFGRIFMAGKYQTLNLYRRQTQKWLVTTPIEWGAGNWHLHVEWDANGRLGALRIRTNDNIQQKPPPRENAPADRIAPGFRSAFPKAW